MDIAWIKVVVLTLAECVAPQGKTVCQEQQVQYFFVDEVECQKVLEQLIDYRDGFDNVIVNKDDSSCQPAAKDLQAPIRATAGIVGSLHLYYDLLVLPQQGPAVEIRQCRLRFFKSACGRLRGLRYSG